jgi:hypothetical protein
VRLFLKKFDRRIGGEELPPPGSPSPVCFPGASKCLSLYNKLERKPQNAANGKLSS